MAHDTLLTWMCDVLLTQLHSVPPVKTLVHCWTVNCRPIQILGKDVCLIDSTQYPLDHQYTGFLQLSFKHWSDINVLCPTSNALLARYTAPWLSISRTMGSLTLSLSDSSMFFIQSMSWTHVTSAYVSALVVDNDTVLSVLLLNIAGAPSRYTTCSETLCLSLGLLA